MQPCLTKALLHRFQASHIHRASPLSGSEANCMSVRWGHVTARVLPHSTSSLQHTFLFCFSTSAFHQTAVQAWFFHRVSQYQVTIQHLQTVLNRLSGENKSRMQMIEKVWFMANCWWSSVFEHEKNRKIAMLNISSTTCNGSWGCYMSASYFLLILCIQYL